MKVLLSFFFLLLGYSWAGCPVGSDPITATDAEDPNPYCLAVVTNKNDNYERAYRKCWNSGTGRLARLGNAYDNNLALYKAAAASNQQNFFYFGLTYSNGSWKYADDELSDLPVTFTKWAPGEPSNPTSRSCAVLNVVDQMWYSMECSIELPYLCDIPAIHDTPPFCTDGINADVFHDR
ncbi:unnamed protein product, partial [Mesorhabditis belari]|uniref:C-type lectin domain-containing protein n=1 Tax=Mesorhabditis belari TaxID=2138241 RepID=A0AAF3FUG6_9BILA